MKKILIIDDNKIIAENTAEFLQLEWYKTDAEFHGEKWYEKLEYAAKDGAPYDLVILDRMLPGLDGLSIARLIKNKKIPTRFLFLTAKDKQLDINEWLEIGGEDYLVKPFDLDELALRIRNILSRWEKNYEQTSWGMVQVGNLLINQKSRIVTLDSVEITLSPKEYSILDFLASNAGQVISREQIFEQVWQDYGSVFTEASDTINVHIAYLRKKIGKSTIRTVKWVGYIIDTH